MSQEHTLSNRRAHLSPAKQALLAQLRQGRLSRAQETTSIEKRSVHSPAPLSFGQQRLLFFELLHPGMPFYTTMDAMLLNGVLQKAYLDQALCMLKERHEILRTTYAPVANELMQIITAPPALADCAIPVVDLTTFSEAERDQIVTNLITLEMKQTFDFVHGPLSRFILLRLQKTSHVLLFSIHHSLFDGWSAPILYHELTTIYNAFLQGNTPDLPALPIQYADFAIWQRQRLQGSFLQEQLAYWVQQLADIPPPFHFAASRSPIDQHTFQSKAQTTTLPLPLVVACQELSRTERATLFMTLLAVFGIVLACYAEQEDLLIGTPIASRTSTELTQMIGFFINMLVMRIHLSKASDFRSLLAQVKQTASDAYAHQDLPFENIVGALHLDRTPSLNPLLQVLFVLQNGTIPRLGFSGLEVKPLNCESQLARFDLTVVLIENEQGLFTTIDYNTDVFDDAIITRMLACFATALSTVTAQPEIPLAHLKALLHEKDQQEQDIRKDEFSDVVPYQIAAHPPFPLKALPVLSAEEQHMLIATFNESHTSSSVVPEQLLHQLIEQQVARTPDAIALAYDDQYITYQEMNIRANQLAHSLQHIGIGIETPVGLFLENSPMLLISILATLKAGATYVPLPPTLPAKRLQLIVQETELQYVLTKRSLSEKLPGTIPHCICLDDEDALRQHEQFTSPTYACAPLNIAYIMYTSGSTGMPKGVMITHLGLTNYVQWSLQAYQVAQGWGTLVQTSLGFDLTITSLFPPLLVGKRVLFLAEQAGIQALKQTLLLEGPFSLLKITPAHLALLKQQVAPAEANGLAKAFVIGGEALYDKELHFWRLHAPDTHLYNEYGPTETVVGCCLYDATMLQPPTEFSSVPIGRPIAHTRCYILDPSLHPVAIGVPGELYVSGSGVGRGYLHRPALTAEVFLPDPFHPLPGTRMYKTGDIALYRENGTIEYQKRYDRQIKLRGFRIELGEIEVVLRNHPDVQEAIVLVSRHTTYEQRLIACVKTASAVDPGTLRDYLKRFLPDYMLPATILHVTNFPLTINGKIDHDALLVLEQKAVETRTLLTPRDLVELELVRIWEGLLRIQPIGVKDDFFDLGGNSFLAMSFLFQLEQQFSAHLLLHTFFEHPTIESVAGHIRQPLLAQKQSSLVPLKAQGTRTPLFLVHPVGGTVLCYLGLARLLDPEQPVYGLQSIGLMEKPPSLHTIEEIAAHYITELFSIQTEGPYWLAGWSMGGIIAFEMARQLQGKGHTVASLVLIDCLSPDIVRRRKRDDMTLLTGFAVYLLGGFLGKQHMSELMQQLLHYPVPQQLSFVLEQVKAANIVPPDSSIEHLTRLFEVFRVNAQAEYRYEIHAYAGQITVLCAETEIEPRLTGPTLGWEKVPHADVEAYILPGDHYSLLKEPYVRHLAEQLKSIGQKIGDRNL